MYSDTTPKNQKHKKSEPKHSGHPRLSPALMEMAKRELKEFEAQSDKAFLIRAEMDRKLTSL